MPHCRFRGAFTPEERKQVERAVTAFEQARGRTTPAAPRWIVMHATPAAGAVYVAVCLDDGRALRTTSVDMLVEAFNDLRSAMTTKQPGG